MKILKDSLKRLFCRLGFCIVNSSRLALELELDLTRLTQDRPITTIFDVGGNFGQTALRFAAAFPIAKVLTFEPVPSSYERLVMSIRGYDRVKPFNVALDDTAGTVEMNLTPDAGKNSIKPIECSTAKVTVQFERWIQLPKKAGSIRSIS